MRRKKLKFTAMFFMGIGISVLQAQEVILPTGGNASGSGGSVSYSVGQVVYTTSTGTNGTVAHGVQQPFEISVVSGIDDGEGVSLTCSAYPNPTNDFLTLKVDASASINIQSMIYKLYDVSGKLLESKKIERSETTIVMSNLVPAIYFLKIYSKGSRKGQTVDSLGNHEVKTFKIIKN